MYQRMLLATLLYTYTQSLRHLLVHIIPEQQLLKVMRYAGLLARVCNLFHKSKSIILTIFKKSNRFFRFMQLENWLLET